MCILQGQKVTESIGWILLAVPRGIKSRESFPLPSGVIDEG